MTVILATSMMDSYDVVFSCKIYQLEPVHFIHNFDLSRKNALRISWCDESDSTPIIKVLKVGINTSR